MCKVQKQRSFKNTVIALLITCVLIAVLPTESEGAIYEDTIRLHILASSDSEADQAVKLAIRDRLLDKYSYLLRSEGKIDEAVLCVSENIRNIENDCAIWLAELGFDYGAVATLGTEWYDTREYEDFSLPCGYYTSLRILLGNAKGKNWWCVMYPPLCLDLATEDAPRDDAIIGYTKEEISLISKNGYNVKFKILELISESVAFSSKNS